MQRIGRIAAIAGLLAALAGPAVAGDYALEMILAPGAGPPLNVHPPHIDETGRAYVFAREAGVTGVWVWSAATGTLEPFLTGATPMPGDPGATIDRVDRPLLNGAGRALLRVETAAGGEVWLGWDPGEGFTRIAEVGMDAPGVPGAVVTDLFSAWTNAEGVVSFAARFLGPGGETPVGSFLREPSGALHLVLQTDTPVPGGPANRKILSPGLAHVDGEGRIAIVVTESLLDGSDPRPVLLRSDGPGEPWRAFRSEPTPTHIHPYGADLAGRLFHDRPDGLWLRSPDDVESLFVPTETALPWIGGHLLADVNRPLLVAGSTTVAYALARNTPGGFPFEEVLFVVGPDGEGREILRAGDPIPGVPDSRVELLAGQPGAPDVRFPFANALGDVAFLVRLESGPGGVTAADDLALLVRLNDGRLYTLVREGDVFEVAPEDERTVTSIQLASDGGPTEGWFSSLNARREVAFSVQFADGTRAAFVARPGSCIDLADDDGDGFVDLADPACAAGAEMEATACQNGSDDDLDGGVDFDGGASIYGAPVAEADPQCATAATPREQDCSGIRQAGLLPMAVWILLRRRRVRG